MRRRTFGTLCLLAALAVTPAAGWTQQAATGDVVTGQWFGDWGPNAQDRNQVRVELKFDGKAVTGTVFTSNRASVAVQKGTYTASTGAVHLEADAQNRGGQTVHYVIDGKLASGAMTGSWNNDNRKGDFKLTKDVISGTWAGDWGPSATHRNQVSLELAYDGKAVTGTAKTPQRADVALKNTKFDAATGTLQTEADAQGRGGAVHYVIEGKVANGTMTGSWNHDATKGDFKVTKK